NVAPFVIGIAKADGFVLTLIQRNYIIPCRRKAALTTSEDNQTTVTICVVAELAPRVRDNVLMGELILDDLPPRPRGVPRIQV
ncbi:hypothetical protein M413DRAFT_40116, partial [Hebeloma cylindrosporum]